MRNLRLEIQKRSNKPYEFHGPGSPLHGNASDPVRVRGIPEGKSQYRSRFLDYSSRICETTLYS